MSRLKGPQKIGEAAFFGNPYWCMNEFHTPYQKESEYDAHMLEIHGIDFANKRVIKRTNLNPWHCSNAEHPTFLDETSFKAHMIIEHKTDLQMVPKVYKKRT